MLNLALEHNNQIKPQAHSDLVYNTLNDYGNEFDIMIEAKHKELALLQYRDILNKRRVA